MFDEIIPLLISSAPFNHYKVDTKPFKIFNSREAYIKSFKINSDNDFYVILSSSNDFSKNKRGPESFMNTPSVIRNKF